MQNCVMVWRGVRTGMLAAFAVLTPALLGCGEQVVQQSGVGDGGSAAHGGASGSTGSAGASSGASSSSSSGAQPGDCNGCSYFTAHPGHGSESACPGAFELFQEAKDCLCSFCFEECGLSLCDDSDKPPDVPAWQTCASEASSGPCEELTAACNADQRQASK